MNNKIIIINGPNINLLGEREQSQYGSITLDELKKNCLDKRRVDGDNTLEWVVIDYGDLIVHIFDEKNREKYSIENVWEKSKEIVRIQ